MIGVPLSFICSGLLVDVDKPHLYISYSLKPVDCNVNGKFIKKQKKTQNIRRSQFNGDLLIGTIFTPVGLCWNLCGSVAISKEYPAAKI
jgi:hypothetical protein